MVKKLPKHLENISRIGCIWYDRDMGKSIKQIAHINCTTEEIIEDILENYEIHQDRICGWD